MTERIRSLTPVGAQHEVPLTGNTITAIRNWVNIKPAGTLAALTVEFPANADDGDEFGFNSTQILTSLTCQASGKTVANPPTTFAAVGGFAKFKYRAADTTWYRIG